MGMEFQRLCQNITGEPEVAIEHAARAMRLSPQDPQIYAMQFATAAAHFFAGRPNEALSWAEKAMQQQPNFFVATCFAAASAALAGSWVQRRKLCRVCASSILRCGFPISRTRSHSGDLNI